MCRKVDIVVTVDQKLQYQPEITPGNLGMDHFILGGGVGQLPKKNSCTAKVEKKNRAKRVHSLTHKQKVKKNSCTNSGRKKKFELRKITFSHQSESCHV